MRYSSTFLEPDGRTGTAVLEAESEQDLYEGLRRDGRLLIKAEQARAVAAATGFRGHALPGKKLVTFTQAMETSLQAGVPLLTALESIRSQENDARVRRVYGQVIDRVSRGESLSEAMGALPGAFSPLYTALVRAGEASGSTDRVFGTMAGFLDWREELKATARQAMIYPAVILTAAFGLILFLLSFVIPRIGEIIKKMVHELPPASRLLLTLSDVVAGNVMLVLFCTALCVTGLVVFCRSPRGGRLMASLFGRLPIARRIVTTLNLAQACRSLAVLLDSGLTMLAAIDLTAATLSLPKLSQGFQSLRKRIEDGARLSEALMATAILPPLAVSMVKVGEDAGSLSQAFLRLATMYDREARSAVKNAIGFLEPAVTVLLGLIVGGVAAIVISTLYKATQGLAR